MKKLKRTAAFALALLFCLSGLIPLSGGASALSGSSGTLEISFSIPVINCGRVDELQVYVSELGCRIDSVDWYDSYGQRITGSFSDGNATVEIYVAFDPGYYFSGSSVVINGSPATYSYDGNYIVASATFTPAVWPPNILKQPGSEKVKVGEMASFAASAAYSSKTQWSVLDPDGNAMTVEELAKQLSGVAIDAEKDRLNIEPVPAKLNGYKFRASFSGPGGDTETQYATLTVTAEDGSKLPDNPVTETVHVHSFSEELISDIGYHFYGCECGATKDKEQHVYTWYQVKDASHDGGGIMEGRCRICGYVFECETELPEIEGPSEADAAQNTGPYEPIETEEKEGFFKRIFAFFGRLFGKD